MIFVLTHTIFVQSLLLKILVCTFAETSNGLDTYNIFTPLLMFVLTKLCVPSLPKISGPCLKPLLVFITYVRPKLEYNLPVWNPCLKKDVHLLESIQKKFSRDVFIRCNIPYTSYADRLHKLDIESLEYRRLEFDVILMFQICHNLSDLQFDDYFIHSKRRCDLRSHEFVIQSKFYANCDQFCNFFFNRIVRIWNSLPYDLVSATSLQVFKRRLKNFDLHAICCLIY